MSQRKARVEHALRDALQRAIANEVKDPRVRAAALVTVAKVELNVDLSVANVYMSIVSKPGARPSANVNDDAIADGVIAGLVKAAGFLRGPIGRELALQRAPELRFMHDSTVDISAKLAAIVREDELRARAVGRKAGEAQPAPEPEAAPESPDAAPSATDAAPAATDAASDAPAAPDAAPDAPTNKDAT